MFQTEDIIGDVVFVSLVNEQEFQSIGITRSGHYLVKGLDNKGLWLQHPGITTNNQEITSYIKEGLFLVMWNQINTIMHYPNREGYDFPSEFDKEIGFLKDK